MSFTQNLGTAAYVVANFNATSTGTAIKHAWNQVKRAVVEDLREKFGKEPLRAEVNTDLCANGDLWNGKGLPTSYTRKVAYEDRDPNVKISHTRDALENAALHIKTAFAYDRADYVKRSQPAQARGFSFGD